MTKVGLSFSRCVRDIVDGTVNIDDVLVVIARTNIDPRDDGQWSVVWEGYGGGGQAGRAAPEWAGYYDEDRFRSVAIELWESGRLHQPRKFGAHPIRLAYHWLEVGLQTADIERNPTVKRAWEQFQVLAGLTNTTTSKDNF